MARYGKYTKIVDGVSTTLFYPEQTADSLDFDGTPVSELPPGAVRANKAARVGKPYLPTALKRVLNLSQFGSVRNSAQLYGQSCDFRPAEIGHGAWRDLGNNVISQFTSDQADGSNKFSDVPENIKAINQTESSLHPGGLEGHYYWMATAKQIEQNYWNVIPAMGPGARWWANIETSNLWDISFYGGPHYPSWDSAKTQRIDLYTTGENLSLEELFANPGKQQAEANLRRAVNCSLMLKIAGRNGAFVGYGSEIRQGVPKVNELSTSGRFLDGADANVDKVKGDGDVYGSNGTITLNGRTYTGLNRSFYAWETMHVAYNYLFSFDHDLGGNYDSIPDYPTLYPHVYNRHPIAYEVGRALADEKRLKDVHGGNTIPILRQFEIHYEGNFARVPATFGTPNGDGGLTKVWLPPYLVRIVRMMNHFMEGERAGAGCHIFHSAGAPNQGIEYNFSTNPRYNHHTHALETYFAAGRDMETILDKIAGTVRTTDIDIKIGGTGDFVTVNGLLAYSRQEGGSEGTLLPCFVTRHKTTSEGLYVIFMGGMDQDWNTTRTDIIRIPGVGSGNTIKIEYKGRDLQVFEVLFPTGVNNTEFSAKSIVSAWQKPGYGGRINNS